MNRMKFLGTLWIGIAAVCVLLTTGFAGSASATVLCELTPKDEGCKNRWAEKTEIVSSLAAGEVSKIVSTVGTVVTECPKSSSKLTTKNIGEATVTVVASFGSFTWENCKNAVTTTTTAEGTVEIHHIDKTDNGTLTGKDLKVTANWAGEDCVFKLGGNFVHIGEFTGTDPGVSVPIIHINTVMAKDSGGPVCPTSAKWTATFQVTSPVKDIFVLKE